MIRPEEAVSLASQDADLREAVDPREAFYRLLHYRELSGNPRLARALLCRYISLAEERFRDRYLPYSAEALAALNGSASPQEVFSGANAFNIALEQSAPVLLTEPVWLQDICQASGNQDALRYALFRVFLDWNEMALDDAYRSLMIRCGGEWPQLDTDAYCRRQDLTDAAFAFAAVQLALAFAPGRQLPEILGYTLACCRCVSMPERFFPGEVRHHEVFNRRKELLKKQDAVVETLISDYLHSGPERRQRRWRRVQNGFWLYHFLYGQARLQLREMLIRQPSPARSMSNLLRRKASGAIGHHGRIRLEGRSLDDWFAGLPENGEAFLAALRRSPYIDNDRPENSRLLDLFAFGGPMFGVLAPNEAGMIRDWIADKASESQHDAVSTPLLPKVCFRAERKRSTIPDYKGLSKRRLFHYLINAEHYPEALTVAESGLRRQLSVYRFFSRLPFKQYSHPAFESYLHSMYRQEMEAYRPLSGEPKVSRQAYLWGLEQVAPTVLIDGVWLQHCHWLRYRYPEVSSLLTGIYADELGNGQPEQSHAVIFRGLMRQLGLSLPDLTDRAFSERERFVDSAFDLPVFMLTLANYPQRYLPELLGLNMAIELSGLGRSYLTLIDELEYWRIDATIARLHVTIDNFADGHAAKARRAIGLYLDEVRAAQGEEAMQRHWRRIFTGFSALKLVCWEFKLTVPAAYMRRKIGGSLSQPDESQQ